MTPSNDQTFYKTMTLLPNLTFYRIAKFPRSICDGCTILTGYSHSSDHLVLSHLRLANDLLVETNTFLNFFSDFTLRTCEGAFLTLPSIRTSVRRVIYEQHVSLLQYKEFILSETWQAYKSENLLNFEALFHILSKSLSQYLCNRY